MLFSPACRLVDFVCLFICFCERTKSYTAPPHPCRRTTRTRRRVLFDRQYVSPLFRPWHSLGAGWKGGVYKLRCGSIADWLDRGGMEQMWRCATPFVSNNAAARGFTINAPLGHLAAVSMGESVRVHGVEWDGWYPARAGKLAFAFIC
uniref:Putative secreted protein n=1 Tax=Anopheles darlingi TaxID=43151 RepID=A0A2M4D539_ANODA